jgi:hypothetical protein
MLPDYEIVAGQGIGSILFGMTREELKGILGDPDEIDIPEDQDGTDLERYQYDPIKCSFSFDMHHKGKLVEISVENGYFYVGNHIRVGYRKEDILNAGLEKIFGQFVIEDRRNEEFPTHELISFDEVGLHLWFDDGKISTIQIRALTSMSNEQ